MGCGTSKKASSLLEMEAQYVQRNLSCPGLGLEGRCGHTRNSLHSCLHQPAGVGWAQALEGPQACSGSTRDACCGPGPGCLEGSLNKAGAARCPLGSTRPSCCLHRPSPVCWYL